MTKRLFSDKEEQEIVRAYKVGMLSLVQIADAYGGVPSTIWGVLKRCGAELRSRSEAGHLAKANPNGHISKGYRILNILSLSNNDQQLARQMTKRLTIKEHRIVVAHHIGQPLTKRDTVHHKDGDKLNNNLSNLAIMTQGQHVVLTRLERWLDKPVTIFTENGLPYKARMKVVFVPLGDDICQ